MQLIRLTSVFAIALLSFVSSGFSAEFRVAISPLVDKTFPVIREALNYLSKMPESPIEIQEKSADPYDVISGGFKVVDVVLGIESEVPSSLDSLYEFESARKIDMELLFVASRENHITSNIVNGTYVHSNDQTVNNFVQFFDNCIWDKKSEQTYMSEIKKVSASDNPIYIFVAFLNHTFVVDSLAWQKALSFKNGLKILPIATKQDESGAIISCLTNADPNGRKYEIVSSFEKSISHSFKDFSAPYQIPKSWYPEKDWQSIQKQELLKFYIKVGKKDDFKEKLFKNYLYDKFRQIGRQTDQYSRKIYENLAGGILLITEGERAVIEVTKARHYWFAVDTWEEKVGYWNLGNTLKEKKLLTLANRTQIKIVLDSLNKYLDELKAGGVRELEYEILNARRILALGNDLLQQDAYLNVIKNSNDIKKIDIQKDWQVKSSERLGDSILHINEFDKIFNKVKNSNEEKHLRIMKQDRIHNWQTKNGDIDQMLHIKERGGG